MNTNLPPGTRLRTPRAPRPHPSLFLLSLLLLCAPRSSPHLASAGPVNVKVLSLMYNKNWPLQYVNALNAGFNASLAARNWTVGPEVSVTVVYPASYDTPAPEHLKNYLQQPGNDKGLLVVLGPMGESDTMNSYATLEENNLVGFAPLTGSPALDIYHPNLYFIRPEMTAEIIALIRYAVSYLRVLRLAFVYIAEELGEIELYQQAVEFMAQMGYEFCCVFVVENTKKRPALDAEFDKAWEDFAAKRPQAVIMIDAIENETERFLSKLVSDPRTKDAFLLAPSLLWKPLVDIWRSALEAVNVSFVPRRVKQTGMNPLAKDGYFDAIKRFWVEMSDYLRSSGNQSGFDDPEYFMLNDEVGELMVHGWIAGEVMMEALQSHGWLDDRVAFMKSLYNQRRYLVDDLAIGDFGGNCTDKATTNGAICHCNRGGRKVYMKEIAEDYRLDPVLGGYITSSPLTCHSDPSILQPPLSGVMISMSDHPVLMAGATSFGDGASAVASDGRVGEVNRFFLQQLNTDAQNSASDIQELQKNRIVTAVFGVVTDAMLRIPSLTFIDPITPTPRLTTFRQNIIHLSPTLEQQLYVLAKYLATHTNPLYAVIRGKQSSGISAILTRTLVTFGMNLTSTTVLQPGDELSKHLPIRGSVFVIGLAVDEVEVLEEHLRTQTKVCVMVQFSEVALLYNEFVDAFNNSESAGRLVFATSLPHWADVNTTSETVRQYHAAIRNATQRSPLSLLGFATGQLMKRNLRRMDMVTPELLCDLFYNESIATANDMRYGPYNYYDCLNGDGIVVDDCVTNFGATNIAVWSMSRALKVDVPVLQEPITPSMIYSDPEGLSLSPAQLAGVIFTAVLGVSLLVGLVVVLYWTQCGARDNGSAPKEPTDPVTLIFTDIESSTGLWAGHPGVMPDAVTAHHRMIRALITSHNCYEVKTVGDSFMIACCSAFAATRLAHDLQQAFLCHEWGTTAFDESYHEFEERKAEDIDGYVPPTARLDPAVYNGLWSGLRVRVGIHTGLCDIRHDEVTKGYDYYGQTTNMAARTESVANGGQVLLTEATYLALSTAERRCLDVTPLGPVPLRGVPEPVEMYQLNAVPGRIFAELRLDRAVDIPDACDGAITSTSDHSSTLELSETAHVIMDSLQSLLGTFTTSQRQKALTLFCERWRIAQPRGAGESWDDECCKDVMRRIAAKVGHVVDYCTPCGNGQSASTLSSTSIIFVSNPTLDCDK
ncbi:unnamed protein product [Trypanosoma congolense IL3000]|uniref:adenylate cyclase n=1 Tax=Trypanosoma congolense (strain IL3000) TaxID=1068625 RepID=F9W7P7_TRYCI|nr:unnamed protein product [Trypanosoma congolense IL3000]